MIVARGAQQLDLVSWHRQFTASAPLVRTAGNPSHAAARGSRSALRIAGASLDTCSLQTTAHRIWAGARTTITCDGHTGADATRSAPGKHHYQRRQQLHLARVGPT
jgi:hypothetical protein